MAPIFPFAAVWQLLLLAALLVSSSFPFTEGRAPWRRQSRAFEIPISGDSSTGGAAALRVGEPAQTVFLLPDTGSSHTWMFCGSPETLNFSSYYNVAGSSTFSPIYCSSPACFDREECSSPGDLCRFTAEYVDGTSVSGFWALDTVTIWSDTGDEVKFRNVTVGCSTQRLSDDILTVNGILGLSPEEPSFTSYMRRELGGGAMAHYVPRDDEGEYDGDSGFLAFGDAARFGALREGMKHVDLIAGGGSCEEPPSFFLVGVSGIFVAGVRAPVLPWVWDFEPETNVGGVILDTGTPLTYVAGEAFSGILALYSDYFRRRGDYDPETFPAVTIEFDGGARLTPFPENLVHEPDEGTKCLGIKANNRSDGSIIGSYFQRGLYWEYDLARGTLGFRAGQ
ncbi:unnamed protein product [Spirodela intermedia]|uniref:Peptidase A1 domain-containing protein n=1 Tax=Spirodela intermedia TaxID=51605 RepID=A0A7I8J8F5_SPIIN|nr:unnamed protein product [Spirodela intermedia]CAA6665733.1 unnamed protein product [Spirodela intermedia]